MPNETNSLAFDYREKAILMGALDAYKKHFAKMPILVEASMPNVFEEIETLYARINAVETVFEKDLTN